jgi:uncharacterized membrane protein YeaQ/YmgE (transglycosylase-associated protein family)
MSSFVNCPGCGLKHSQRSDGKCPRCKQVVAEETAPPAQEDLATAYANIGSTPSYADVRASSAAGIAYSGPDFSKNDGGSYGTGLAIGIVFGLTGAVITHFVAQPLTKRGAWHGFFGRIVVSAIVVFLIAVVVASAHR